MELKRIDTLWHFFATQNNLFLRKKVEMEISYTFLKGNIQVIHIFKPNFLEYSSLTIQARDFEVAVQHYAAAKKRFGIKEPFPKNYGKLFFPKELLKLKNIHSFFVEKDRSGLMKVTLVPFSSKKYCPGTNACKFDYENFMGYCIFFRNHKKLKTPKLLALGF